MKLVDFILNVIDILHYMEIASIFLFLLAVLNHATYDNILIFSFILCLLSSILILIAMLIYYYITDKNDKKLT